jgi:hypothetical protein
LVRQMSPVSIQGSVTAVSAGVLFAGAAEGWLVVVGAKMTSGSVDPSQRCKTKRDWRFRPAEPMPRHSGRMGRSSPGGLIMRPRSRFSPESPPLPRAAFTLWPWRTPRIPVVRRAPVGRR